MTNTRFAYLPAISLAAWLTLTLPASAADSPALTVVDESQQKIALSAEQLEKLPQHKVGVSERDGSRHAWEGPLLGDVLKAAGVPLEKQLRGPRLTLYLLVEAADGYCVVFALPELDPTNSDSQIILALRRDGSPLDAKEGPYRIIAPGEKRHARWVKQVTRLVVESAGETDR